MSEATETASQPQETTQAQDAQHDYSAFLGGASNEPDLVADESPAPDAEQEGTEAEAEPDLLGEPEAEQEQEEAEPEQQAEVVAEGEAEEAEQPPSVEERLKDILPRELESYQQRYPTAWKMLQDPKTPEDLKHLLLDKIDGDHEIQRRIASERQTEEEGEPTAQEVEAEQPAAVTAIEPAKQREAYYTQIDNLVKGFDQQSLKDFGDSFLRMFNVNTKLMDDPNASAEDKAVLTGIMQSVQKEAPVLARYMADTVSTMLPHALPAALELIAPGWQAAYDRQSYGRAWETVRSQVDGAGKPLYPGLPAYPGLPGTPEAQKFGDMLEAAAAQIDGFNAMVFTDPQSGRVLPREQQAQMKYAMLARVASGQRVNPAVIAQAVATGKKLAGKAQQQRLAGRALGAGQPTAKTTFETKGGANSDEDPLLADLDREIAAQETNVPVKGRRGAR